MRTAVHGEVSAGEVRRGVLSRRILGTVVTEGMLAFSAMLVVPVLYSVVKRVSGNGARIVRRAAERSQAPGVANAH